MCGIVGAVARRPVDDILIEGLLRLEYRGYDSAGVSFIEGGQLHLVREVGKVSALQEAMNAQPSEGKIGIAHTRWATHGVPATRNSHPHASRTVAVVHNGIIENHDELRAELQAQGFVFHSETDTEVVAHLLQSHLDAGKSLQQAVFASIPRLHGAYALAIIASESPDQLWLARKGSPLCIGLGLGENFAASDATALLRVTNRFVYLAEGDIASISRSGYQVFDAQQQPVVRKVVESSQSAEAADKGEYKHFMAKEIHEQPQAIASTLQGRTANGKVLEACLGVKASELLDKVQRVRIVACGTSAHAGMVAKYWFESIAKTPCQVELASEFRYRTPLVEADTLFITISQSGETADTLEALRHAKTQGIAASLVICNAPESSLVRESDIALMTHAGPERSVASTKAFTTQLAALALVMLLFARRKGLSSEDEAMYIRQLESLPGLIEDVLEHVEPYEKMAEAFRHKKHTLFLGRGAMYPVAMEGALKLKEITYIHAESYAAGELKHGPLALVDETMPIVVVAPSDDLIQKVRSNVAEVAARKGEVFVLADQAVHFRAKDDKGQDIALNIHNTLLPEVPALIAPMFYTVPLQLLAYYTALLKGTDIDQPRNLAKSVTVE